jgi:hypothetical protein
VWHRKLLWDLAEVLRWLIGSGIARREEIVGGGNGATAGNRNSASRWNDQGNTWACKLSGCGRKL